MDIRNYLKLSKKYNNCPDCGSDLLGEGLGKLELKNDIFTRSCECGFHIEVDVNKKGKK